jgi:Tripartite tricarboxylate transporter TctB family
MSNESGAAADDRPRGAIKSTRELGAGLFLLALAAFALAGAYGLKFGQLSGIGPGLMPKVTAAILAGFGLLLIIQSFTTVGDRLEPWSMRGIIFVLGAVLVFAATVRTAGLIVAGPLAVMISALADRDTKWWEVAIFAVVLTGLCGFMFKDMLGLPIPFDPLGLVPNDVAAAYVTFKKWFASTVLGLFKS